MRKIFAIPILALLLGIFALSAQEVKAAALNTGQYLAAADAHLSEAEIANSNLFVSAPAEESLFAPLSAETTSDNRDAQKETAIPTTDAKTS